MREDGLDGFPFGLQASSSRLLPTIQQFSESER